MKKTRKKKRNLIQLPFMALLLVVMVAVNYALSLFADAITIYLAGYGINFDNLDYAQGNQICQDIAEEGIVLLKNEDENGEAILPLDMPEDENEKYPVAVFGWGATDGGFITSGAGSGSSASRGAGNLVTFLEALEGKEEIIDKDSDGNEYMLMPEVWGRFDYYDELIDMYKTYKSGRNDDNYWSQAYPFFNLIEPSVTKVQEHLNGAVAHSDTAIVVLSRVGGESKDIPQTQVKVNPNTNNPDRNNNKITDSSRTYLQLSTEEEDMLDLVKENFDKVIVVINACNAMDLDFLEADGIDAAVSVSGTGQSGTVALANILAGNKKVVEYEKDENGKTLVVDGATVVKSETIVPVSPSGKTVDTYAYDHTTAATFANAPNAQVVNGASGGVRTYSNSSGDYYIDYAEGIYVGYKWYETADAEGFWDSDYAKDKWVISSGYEDVVQYPFGYGLSYTEFDWTVTNVSPSPGSEIKADTEISITVRVDNLGTMPGQDVVQVYYNPPYYDNGIEKSAVNLVAFRKTISLAPAGEEGDSETFTISFKAEEMKSYDSSEIKVAGGGYILEKGDYEISLRTDAHNLKALNADSEYENVVSYNVKSDIELDTETVKNVFTGDSDQGDVSIDGTTTDANITYLKRSDMENTFPTPQARREKSSKILRNGWLNTTKETDETTITGMDNGLYLYNEDGTLNKELVLQLGADYDDPDWDLLLDQLTVKEMNDYVQGGGYRTKAIPSINKPDHTDLDGPSGLNQENMTSGEVSSLWTSYPVETVLAQAWNAKLSYIYGLAVGNEAYNTQVAGWYAPGANIHRSPFSGRNFEYYSEDSYLSGIMASETVRGATNTGLYCYIKHFAVNETEFHREQLYTWLTEQSLREIYLKPFEMCVKEGNANAMMSSYNRIGGTWAGGDYRLLTTVLREEWGFRGSIVTDYANLDLMGYMDIDQGLRAGNDIWLDGTRTGILSNYDEKNTATGIACAREAVHNSLYTFCNTIYLQDKFVNGATADEDAAKYATQVGSKEATQAAATWVYWGWIPLNVVGFGGLLLWFVAFLRSPQKKSKSRR